MIINLSRGAFMKIIVTMIIFACSLQAFARDGSSGCGPGWYVFQKNSILSSSLRATTNGILLPTVTIGMTFGTSNCAKHSLVMSEKEGLKFATENYFEIAFESAKGNGPSLTTYGDIMGCRGKSLELFKNKMKKNTDQIFSKDSIDPQKVLKETYIMIFNDKELGQSCFAS